MCNKLHGTANQNLGQEKWILALPDPKRGTTLCIPPQTLVCEFYQLDDVSQVMPGRKEFVSVREQGNCIDVQKRFVLSDL